MKLIIQIPCFNEEESLPLALADLPREIPGIDVVEWLVINDGSLDRTSQVARDCGVDYIISHPQNLGLAKAFMTGLETCLEYGADIIVNTDGDNQYCAADIPTLIDPILKGEADLVVGARPIHQIQHFSWVKKLLQFTGSRIVRIASGTKVVDAPSGFRAISRNAAMQLNVFTRYSYTLETIIQAGHNGITIQSVPVRVNGKTRPSRLVKNIPTYLWQSLQTILRIFAIYKPLRVFTFFSFFIFLLGFLFALRFLYFYIIGEGQGHVQSVILSVFLMGSGFLLSTIGLLSDLISVNRKLLEKLNFRMQKLESQVLEETRRNG